MIVIGGLMGEKVENGRVVARQYQVGCDRHKTPIEMTYAMTTDKEGNEEFFYTCPTCRQSVRATEVEHIVEKHNEEKLRKPTLL